MEEKFPMRINKYLALKNYSTRRGADVLIQQKKVTINGRVAVLGDKVLEKDIVVVKISAKEKLEKKYIYIAYNKPKGLATEEIIEKVNMPGIFPVGRLDKDSRGLIILTNDGRVTDRLLGPKYFHEKEYTVITKSPLRSNFKAKMEAGVQIDADKTAPCKVQILGPNKFKVILTEGKKHQIRRMCVALFQEVEDLKRIRIMNIKLEKMPEGQYRTLESKELETFLKSLALL